MTREPTEVALDRIYLDEKNPRFEPVETQAEAISLLCTHENILPLAEDIVENGLNPLELFALIPDENRRGTRRKTYIVAEGNRRVCALKLLADPDLAPGRFRKAFAELADDWSGPTELESIIFSDRDEVDLWLTRIHDGEQAGRGRRKWNADQSARHSGSNKNKLALAVLDYAEQSGAITAEDRKGKLTTVQRYLTNRKIQEALGIDASDLDNVRRTRPKADFDALIEKFIDDLKESYVNSRAKKEGIEAYARELSDVEGLTGKRVKAVDLPAQDTKKAQKKKRRARPSKRVYLPYEEEIMDALKGLGSEKLENLYNSITGIQVSSHTPLLTIGAWAFLESLSGRAGRKASQSFQDFFNKARLQKYGLSEGKGDKALTTALKRISENGDVTKHHGIGANFDGKQLGNDLDTLKALIIKCIEEAADEA